MRIACIDDGACSRAITRSRTVSVKISSQPTLDVFSCKRVRARRANSKFTAGKCGEYSRELITSTVQTRVTSLGASTMSDSRRCPCAVVTRKFPRRTVNVTIGCMQRQDDSPRERYLPSIDRDICSQATKSFASQVLAAHSRNVRARIATDHVATT